MTRKLYNFDVASLYPNIVKIYGYSSRNQLDKNKYVETLDLRMDAKYGRVDPDFLKVLDVTNDDLKVGLKLPINAYTGALRAVFNALYDPVQGFSICTTGQLFILQLIHDLQKVPTLEMVSANTDAVMYTIEDEYQPEALAVLKAWQDLTQLVLEEDKVVKIIMRDVNNYCEIVQTGDNDYKVNYKGGEFKGKHKFKWDKEEKIFRYSFDDEIEANSLTIISEALLKNLLFNVPLEDTINSCDDIFRFQTITHLGHTYEKMVQESPDGDIELQRNNRVYAGNKPSGLLIKVKSNGRRDSLANCPINPIVDNANKCTIDDINKEWYIKLARQKLNDFKGVKRLEAYKKTELLEMATKMGFEVDSKMKKDELIKLIELEKERIEIYGERIVDEMSKENVTIKDLCNMNLYQKINEIKKDISAMDFVMDCVMPTNLGGKEYPSIGQYYKVIQDLSIKYHLLFKWEVIDIHSIEKDMFKPQGKMPQHVSTVECRATFTDIDAYCFDENGCSTTPRITYTTYASGSDTCDKGVSGASALAFRNWFDKNFTPKYLTTDDFDAGSTETGESEKSEEPKVPTYIPPEKKQELTKTVVNEVQKEESDEEDVKEIIDKIMKVRGLLGDDNWGAATVERLLTGELGSADIVSIGLKVDNKLESLEAE